jgi:hypothetical protein
LNPKYSNNNLFSNKYSKEDCETILSLIPYKELTYPIQQHNKKFRNEIKGFRPNKLPQKMLFGIYINNIYQKSDVKLMKYIELRLQDSIEKINDIVI